MTSKTQKRLSDDEIAKLAEGEPIEYSGDQRYPGSSYWLILLQQGGQKKLGYFHLPHCYQLPTDLESELRHQLNLDSASEIINVGLQEKKRKNAGDSLAHPGIGGFVTGFTSAEAKKALSEFGNLKVEPKTTPASVAFSAQKPASFFGRFFKQKTTSESAAASAPEVVRKKGPV